MNTDITTKQVLSYIIRAIKPFPVGVCAMFLVAIVWSIDLSVKPYLLKVIFDRLAAGTQHDVFAYLTVPALLFLGMYFLMTTTFRLYGYFVEIRMIPRLRERIANEALGLLMDKSHTYYQNNFSGSLSNKVNDLTNSIPDIMQLSIDRFFSHAMALTVAIITLWHVNVRFAFFMLVWTAIFIFGGVFFSKHLTRLARKWSEFGSIITGKLVDVLSNILSVRLFTAKSQETHFLFQTFQGAVKAVCNDN